MPTPRFPSRALLATLAVLALAAPASAERGFPTERALGLTVGLIGPGAAYRQFVTPEWGLQVGANTLWVPSLGVFSGGGQIMYSPVRVDGKRCYSIAGLGWTTGGAVLPKPLFTPGLGVGVSSTVGQGASVFLDLTYLFFSPGPGYFYPQFGFTFHL